MKADADGLMGCVENALQTLGVDNILDRLSVHGVKGKSILIGEGQMAHQLLPVFLETDAHITQYSGIACTHTHKQLPCM